MSERDTSASISWALHVLLLKPRAIAEHLEAVRAANIVEEVPNLWQLWLGVVRMWHRIVFRSETIGTSPEGKVRSTLRARLLQHRALRLPFLLREGAIAPLDLTGLASPPERLIRHLVGAHHDKRDFVFDLEILSCYPGALERLRAEVETLLAREDERGRWLRDLTVFEGYHESLHDEVLRALESGIELTAEQASDADASFRGYLSWCAAQPETPRAMLQMLWKRARKARSRLESRP